jgi:hypothetical protein
MSHEHWSSPNGCHDDCPACLLESPRWAITCESDRNLMWSNEDGWIDTPTFDLFSDIEKAFLRLPVEGRWVLMVVDADAVKAVQQ